MKDTKNVADSSKPNSATPKSTQQLLQIIDTTLLKCYLEVSTEGTDPQVLLWGLLHGFVTATFQRKLESFSGGDSHVPQLLQYSGWSFWRVLYILICLWIRLCTHTYTLFSIVYWTCEFSVYKTGSHLFLKWNFLQCFPISQKLRPHCRKFSELWQQSVQEIAIHICVILFK